MRTSLRVAALLALAAFLVAAPVVAKGHKCQHSLAGTWIISVTYYDFGILTFKTDEAAAADLERLKREAPPGAWRHAMALADEFRGEIAAANE